MLVGRMKLLPHVGWGAANQVVCHGVVDSAEARTAAVMKEEGMVSTGDVKDTKVSHAVQNGKTHNFTMLYSNLA